VLLNTCFAMAGLKLSSFEHHPTYQTVKKHHESRCSKQNYARQACLTCVSLY